MAKNSKILGIYMDIREIVLATASAKGSDAPLEKIVSIPTNFQIKDKVIKPVSLNNDFFNEKQEWVIKFKEAVKKGDFGAERVNVTLSHNFSITRFFVMPFIDRKFWGRSIPIESRKYIPMAFDEMTYDYSAHILSDSTKIGVLFGITQRKTVEFIMQTLKTLSLELYSIETSSASWERLVSVTDPKDHDKKAYAHFSKGNAYTLFSVKNCPVVFREIALEDPNGISERRSLDLKGSMAFVKRNVQDQNYSEVVVSGDNAQLWQKLAETESGLKTEILDISKKTNLKVSAFSHLAAIGASLKDSFKHSREIDISGISAGKRLNKTVQNYVILISVIVAGFFLFLAFVNNIQIYSLSGRVSSLKNQMGSDIDEFQGLTEDMVKTKVDEMQTKARMMRLIFQDKEYLAPKLGVLADSIPQDLWLDDISYSNPISINETEGQGKELNIIGETALAGDYKVNLVDYFTRELKKAPEFRNFVPPKGSIESSLQGAGDAVKNMIGSNEEKSGFNINCSQKRKKG